MKKNETDWEFLKDLVRSVDTSNFENIQYVKTEKQRSAFYSYNDFGCEEPFITWRLSMGDQFSCTLILSVWDNKLLLWGVGLYGYATFSSLDNGLAQLELNYELDISKPMITKDLMVTWINKRIERICKKYGTLNAWIQQ